VLLGPVELSEVQDQWLLRGGLGGEVEVLEGLVGGQRGVADAVARPGRVAGEDLRIEQHLEELLVGPALGARRRCRLLEPLEHARRLELAQEVGQPLADRLDLRLGAHAQSSA